MVESGDRAAIRATIEPTRTACDRALGAGGPPKCLEGETLGEEVAVFEYLACEREWVRTEDLEAMLEATLSHPLSLYAAFTSTRGYEAVFEATDKPVVGAGVLFVVRDGRVVAMQRTCGAGDTAAALIPAGRTDFLVAPDQGD